MSRRDPGRLALSACGEDEEDEEDEEEPAEPAGDGGVQAVESGRYEYALGDTSDAVLYEEGDAQAVVELTADQAEIGEHADPEGAFGPDQIAA